MRISDWSSDVCSSDLTSNFLHGIPHFAISIAVEEPRPNGTWEPMAAMVYQPLTDESFWAEKGRGAWLQEKRLRVSARRDLADAQIAPGVPFLGHGHLVAWTHTLRAGAPAAAGIRRPGRVGPD